jgi:hypothetical protein
VCVWPSRIRFSFFVLVLWPRRLKISRPFGEVCVQCSLAFPVYWFLIILSICYFLSVYYRLVWDSWFSFPSLLFYPWLFVLSCISSASCVSSYLPGVHFCCLLLLLAF